MALILPALLTLLFGIIDGGRAANVWLSVTQATRYAARSAVAGGEAYILSGSNAVVNPGLTCDIWSKVETYVGGAAVALPASATNPCTGKPAPATVTVTCQWVTSSGVTASGACSSVASQQVDLQLITIQSSVQLGWLTPMTGLIPGLKNPITINATSSMRAE
jgi:hypothetical protein